MKKIHYITLLFLGLLLTGCEEVVTVDLDTMEPKLVIDARIDWVKGTDGSHQTIRLTKTAGYYDDTVLPATGATVFITNSANTQFDFVEVPGTGDYVCDNFVPVIGETYTLTVTYEDETYSASEPLFAAPDITNIIQDNEGGFLNEDIEVRFFWMDNAAEENYYLVKFDTEVLPYADYDVLEDEFFNGNEMFDFIDHEDFEPGQVVDIRLYGISRRYSEYMMKVISMVEGGGGSGPFQSPPINARGNITNQTDENNFPLGYFRLGEVDTEAYTITE